MGGPNPSVPAECPEHQSGVFNEGICTQVVGRSAKALEQFAIKRTCGSHSAPVRPNESKTAEK